MTLLQLLLLVTWASNSKLAIVCAARVLVVLYQQPSHVLMKIPIGEELALRGHDVYFTLTDNNPIADVVRHSGMHVLAYRPADGVLYPFTKEYEENLVKLILQQNLEADTVCKLTQSDCSAMIEDPALLDRARALQFDLAVVEPFAANPCHLIIPRILGIPYVSATAIFMSLALRIPALPSFYMEITPGPSPLRFPDLRLFSHRLKNLVHYIGLHLFVMNRWWGDQTLLRKYTPGVETWNQLLLESEMILIENDHHLSDPMPLLPHVITIAGCSARPPQPLLGDVERIFDQSGEDGVILVSFGSSAHRWPPEITAIFLEAFGRLKETVLARLEASHTDAVPRNVHLLTWLPQNDILGHPKTKLFVTHCGTNSQYEALYHGIPMVGIPMFAEQRYNCARAERKGISLCLEFIGLTSDQLYDNIRELIDNATYGKNVREISRRWRNEPLIGREKAAFWIDHVIKYGGRHLRSPAMEQPIYQLLLLDVMLVNACVFVGLMLVVVLVAFFFLKTIFKKIRKTKVE